MPSSITLTVSHLPTSNSFFLSALQPLEYVYRGRSNDTIGFGSATNPSTPADFWITQEIPGVPVGAAHVAFHAPSKTAVQQFFTAALKAGGNIHGEPAVRDSDGYYSAAVIDFDGNSIEAVFRPDFSENKENDVTSTISSRTMTELAPDTKSQTSRAPPSGAKSSFPLAAPPTELPAPIQRSSSDRLGSIISDARSAANVARNLAKSVKTSSPSHRRSSGEGDSNVILGTLLGVAAGAAFHYALTHDKGSKPRPSVARSFTEPSRYQSHHQAEGSQYPTLENNDYASTMRPARSTTSSHRSSHRGQTVYATGFDNGTLAPPSESRATQQGSNKRMIEAPPSSFKAPLPPRSSSSHSRSSSHRSRSHQITSPSYASRPSVTRHMSYDDRTAISSLPPLSTPPAIPSSIAKPHPILRTTSDSRVAKQPLTANAPFLLPPNEATSPIRPLLRPAPLSEANIQRVITTPSAAAAPSPRVAVSLHSCNREDETYPIALDRRGRKERGSKGRSRVGSTDASRNAGAGNRDPELTPHDSVSQISSVRSASTVRAKGKR